MPQFIENDRGYDLSILTLLYGHVGEMCRILVQIYTNSALMCPFILLQPGNVKRLVHLRVGVCVGRRRGSVWLRRPPQCGALNNGLITMNHNVMKEKKQPTDNVIIVVYK